MITGAEGGNRRRKRKRPEQAFQAALVRALYSILTPQTFWFAVPNGGYRRKAEAGILIGQGVKPGVPDIMQIHGGQSYGLELKSTVGVLSEAQKRVHNEMRAAGVRVEIARDIDDAIAALMRMGIPLRISNSSQFQRSAA